MCVCVCVCFLVRISRDQDAKVRWNAQTGDGSHGSLAGWQEAQFSTRSDNLRLARDFTKGSQTGQKQTGGNIDDRSPFGNFATGRAVTIRLTRDV